MILIVAGVLGTFPYVLKRRFVEVEIKGRMKTSRHSIFQISKNIQKGPGDLQKKKLKKPIKADVKNKK